MTSVHGASGLHVYSCTTLWHTNSHKEFTQYDLRCSSTSLVIVAQSTLMGSHEDLWRMKFPHYRNIGSYVMVRWTCLG